ncbi:M16 family metallopeptidase [Leptolyngbya sp. 7M]|uniref:M16 family metallopeptidase n=1 Tax=Leptolyngbya sp. 7M TaxID=2812896 RepID=UPI001B8CCEAB|nr:pitrilysin family protein [Leptolyngbya sp. 7M]QYO66578.1 insulinase family protein [Leptolyngbya sp. 7M]
MSKVFRAQIALFIVLSLVFVPLSSVAVNAQTASSVPKIEFEKFTLPNGLQVILHVDRKLPVVHVNQWFFVGSANERLGRSGFAHLFEHMMFQGSKNATKEYFDYVEAAGANLLEGGVNGTTNQDRTNYFATVPSGNLENLLWLEADRLATLPEALTKESLDNQIMVVRNERRQGLENQPYGRSFKLLGEALFPAGHPYQSDVIGVHEDLAAATLDDVKDFFRRFYTPNNLSLVISGDFDPAEAKRLVEKYFGTIPPGPALERPAKGKVSIGSEKIVEVRDRVPQERTYFGWHSPAYFDAGDAEMNLAASILTTGLSSRLQRSLVYEKQLATNVAAFQSGQPLAGWFGLLATARPGVKLEDVEKAVIEEIAKLAQQGPTEAELARAKTRWEYQFVSGLESIGGFGGKSDRLNQYNTFLGDPGMFDEDVARHRAVTRESLQRAVAEYLNTNKRVLVRFRPEPSSRALDIAVDRSQMPPLGGDRPFTAPSVKTAKLENGLEVFVVEKPELPKVLVGMATRAGTIADASGKEGIAAMTARMLRRGTKTKQALQIDEALGDLGTNISGQANREYATLGSEVLTRDLDSLLAVMSDVVLNPSFPADEFEKEKQLTLDGLKQAANNPNSVANRVAAMIAYGADHPYGRPAGGLPGSVATITRDDLVRFHQERWKPGSSAMIFVGDVTLNDAVAAARKHFGSWSGGSAPAMNIPAKRPMSSGKVYLVDRPGAAQTVVSHILNAPERKSQDYYALSLANAVYGGGFGTRLNLNLREEKGYSYGVFAFPQHYSTAGAWIANGGVQTDKTKESIVEFMKELRYIAGEKPITQAEFEKAKLARIRGYAQQFEAYQRIGHRSPSR